MKPAAIFAIAAVPTAIFTASRYDGKANYDGPEISTKAGGLSKESGAPDPSNHKFVLAAAGISGAIGGSAIATPHITNKLGRVEVDYSHMTNLSDIEKAAYKADDLKTFWNDARVFPKVGASFLGIGAGLAAGIAIAKMTD